MFCDYQLFWHEHFKRPKLSGGSIKLSGTNRYETMLDNGDIVWREFDLSSMMNEALAELRKPSTMVRTLYRRAK